ncbi:presenilin family intramembrane aspartyl protease [Candidatus Bathyarchaeota archaeon]|nr:presenilin family intramembrane aspartyl protease [Candidatus Bathyarchaeota archaeon]
MTESFKTRPVHLLPVLLSLLFGVLCTYLVLQSPMEMYDVTPFPEGVGSLFNALYFVVLTAVGATLLYLLLRRKKIKSITLVTGFALTLAVLLLSFIYLWAVFSIIVLPYTVAVILDTVISAVAAAAVDVAVFRNHSKASEVAVLLLGGGLGAFLGVSIPTLSALLILFALAVYDVFAVYRGAVGKIAHSGLDQLRGLSFTFKDVQMGLGDLTFYSLLTSLVWTRSMSPVFLMASIAGVLLGVFIAFKMLERKGIFPGLPFPITLGLLPFLVYLFLSGTWMTGLV